MNMKSFFRQESEHKGNKLCCYRTFYVILFLLTISVSVVAQNRQISLSLQNASLKTFFAQIEKQSPYRFSYRDADVDSKGNISISVTNSTIDAVLKDVLSQKELQYTISSNKVIITPRQQQNTGSGQSKKISGVVVDDRGEPIIGANVSIKGTTHGTITDIDGHFSMEANAGQTLLVSYIGYAPKELAVTNQSSYKVSMAENTQALDEVVVVGYGTQRKSDVTGSIAVADAKDILRVPSFSAIQGLKGIAPGVNVFTNSGQPGGANRVVVRGISTIKASSSPLYVVDGVVMDDFQFLNPNDIERMEVLKDASAAAIYGARGANGVILVTTKRGLQGDGTTVSYSGYVSMSMMGRRMETMNSAEFMDAMKISMDNAVKYGGKSQADVTQRWNTMLSNKQLFNPDGSPIYDTDWQKEATRNAVSHNHQISIQQGGKNSSVGAFLNYTDQEGIMLNTYMKRLNAKLTYDAKPTQWLSTGVNLLVNHTWQNSTAETGGGQEARRTMIEMPPIFPVKYADGNWSNSTNGVTGFGFEALANPVHILTERQNMAYRTQIFGNASLTFHLADGLDLKTQFGTDAQIRRWRHYTPNNMTNLDSNGMGVANVRWHDILFWQEETYLSYNKVFGKHRINAVAGLSWQERTYRENYDYTKGFFDNYFGYDKMQVGTTPNSPESNYERWAMNSYFLRGAYTYNDRYMATITARADGSSRFGSGNKYAFFPSLGLGWMISQEDFMKDISWIDQLKLHTSYGMTGNSEIGIYQSLSTVSVGTTLINGQRVPSTWPARLANPNLKWEKTGQFDVGVNAGFFNNRLTLDLSYYYKLTTDLLLDKPIPNSTGFSTVTDNIGSVSNRGLDIMVGGDIVRNKVFTWNASLNANYNKNRIEKLGETDADILTNPNFLNGQIILRKGESLGSFFAFRRLGIVQNEAQAKETGKRIGTAIRSKDREIIGKGLPDWTGSFINKFQYKNFDLMIDLQFVAGVQANQHFYHSTEDRFGLTSGLKSTYTQAWSPSNPNTMVQAIRNGTFDGQDSNQDSHWIVDGSYLRGNLFQVGYTFEPKTLKSLHLGSLRTYLSVENAFVITSKDFQGYDPEATSYTDQFSQNIFFFSYPRPITFTFGVNVSF